ncbi:MAG TPA: lipoyl(octanoyl) transferase LipB [Candidatus Gastranaerophilales bacterium]|nr:lipoyl(octanoyl) transferase LipB [Candidatus Gastranaerophilales bacterium]
MWIIENLGIIDYQKALNYQEKLVKLKQDGEKNNFFLLLEHFPVFTRGKSAKDHNILDKDIPVVSCGRGGDLTCHEPGQLVGYIILDLKKEKLTVKEFVNKIENLIINSLKEVGISAYKHPDFVGVWAKNKKIASIGIAIKKGITMHGFAINVNNNLEGLKKINPCGMDAEDFSSLKKLTEQNISIEIMRELITKEFKNMSC